MQADSLAHASCISTAGALCKSWTRHSNQVCSLTPASIDKGYSRMCTEDHVFLEQLRIIVFVVTIDIAYYYYWLELIITSLWEYTLMYRQYLYALCNYFVCTEG